MTKIEFGKVQINLGGDDGFGFQIGGEKQKRKRAYTAPASDSGERKPAKPITEVLVPENKNALRTQADALWLNFVFTFSPGYGGPHLLNISNAKENPRFIDSVRALHALLIEHFDANDVNQTKRGICSHLDTIISNNMTQITGPNNITFSVADMKFWIMNAGRTTAVYPNNSTFNTENAKKEIVAIYEKYFGMDRYFS